MVPAHADVDSRARRLTAATPWTAGVLFWIVLPLVAIIVVVASSMTFAHRVHAQPQGTSGTYVATIRSCQGNVCQIAGTFTSDDGSFVARSVLGDYRWKVGEKHRVVFNTESEVIALPSRWNPTATVIGGAAGVIVLISWVALVLGAVRRHRHRRREPRA